MALDSKQYMDLTKYEGGDILWYEFKAGITKKKYIRVMMVTPELLEAIANNPNNRTIEHYKIKPGHTHIKLRKLYWYERVFFYLGILRT